ncbi:acyl-CoA N-acyltransferase [Lentinula aciculospora]|uniref:Acyl-CoA N-acyltransferase n=1 Tax=Lentinula aciculospora TaxID=153920 RepID=A0A9W9AK79_9AGAR|nr:acyl-CoA N-acyltransferase [Lentinula aciculospora]
MPSAQELSVLISRDKPLPNHVLNALDAIPVDANVILPFLKKSTDGEHSSPPLRSLNQVWLSCLSCEHGVVTVDMVLSCTANEIGNYPIFIVPTQPVSHWNLDSLKARLHLLAKTLRDTVRCKRVFSVFAPDTIVSLFSQQWSELVGVTINNEPYYAARLLSCTAVLPPTSMTPPPGTSRLAVAADSEAVARLCKGFSEESEPFVLRSQEATKEAGLLISKSQVWVHCVSGTITCIAAFTRNTSGMATITKVYTHRSWRRRGYAKCLVREVARYLLGTGRREVVLYVAHNNNSAAKVYESVGFVEPDAAVEVGHSVNWTEVGFDRNYVDLGHW